jgi:pimeloyl-ACP methyl ester carboxylesterase
MLAYVASESHTHSVGAFFGWSMGTQVGLEFATLYPSAVDRCGTYAYTNLHTYVQIDKQTNAHGLAQN